MGSVNLGAVVHECSSKQMFLKMYYILQEIPVLESLFNKVAFLKDCNFTKKRLPQIRFLVNIAKFLRTPYFTEQFGWLLL